MKNNIEQRIKRLGLTCTVGDRQFVNGIEVVDLGLPSGTLWTKCNLGAECETDRGTYHQFGYFEPYEKTCGNYEDKEFGSIHGFTVPTKEQFRELLENTEHMWTTINGVSGYKFTSKVDETKYVFFPPAGICFDGGVNNVGSYGRYWSSSLYSSDVQNAYVLLFLSGTVYWQNFSTRRVGRSLRLVFGS
jgi:hypothetical protein